MNKSFMFVVVVLIAVASYNVIRVKNHENKEVELTLKNVEALASFEGTNASYCYIKVSDIGTRGWQVFCNEKTDANTIYPCPSETHGLYYDMAKDRCTK